MNEWWRRDVYIAQHNNKKKLNNGQMNDDSN